MSLASPSPVLLPIGEVARRLSISVRSVRALIERGVLATVRVTERRVAVDEADLAAYVEARRTGPRGNGAT